MGLEIQDGESQFQYHRRLVYGKLVDKTLSDIDYSELSEAVYGQPYSSDVARRMMYGSKRTLELMDSESRLRSEASMIDDIEKKILEYKKERQKFFDYRNAYNRSVRSQAREELFRDMIRSSIMDGGLPELNYHRSDTSMNEGCGNDLVVSLNDIHYGMVADNNWNKYNPDICADMFRQYIDKIVSIAQTHQSENCYILCNGDMISGNNHITIQVENKETVVKQIEGVCELIAQFIYELSPSFNNVYFLSVAGNHSRITKKDDAPIDERLDDLVRWYLEARLQNVENAFIVNDNIDPTMYCVDIRGKTYIGVHGDYSDTSVGKIGAIQAMIKKPIYCIMSGHLHKNEISNVNGIKTVMAGSFLGMDSYCIQKRLVGDPEQLVCVVNEDGIMCYYDIKFDK